jgi:hypothetical protein
VNRDAVRPDLIAIVIAVGADHIVLDRGSIGTARHLKRSIAGHTAEDGLPKREGRGRDPNSTAERSPGRRAAIRSLPLRLSGAADDDVFHCHSGRGDLDRHRVFTPGYRPDVQQKGSAPTGLKVTASRIGGCNSRSRNQDAIFDADGAR